MSGLAGLVYRQKTLDLDRLEPLFHPPQQQGFISYDQIFASPVTVGFLLPLAVSVTAAPINTSLPPKVQEALQEAKLPNNAQSLP